MTTPSNVNTTPSVIANLQRTKALTFNVVAPNQALSRNVIDAVVWLPLGYRVHHFEGNVFQDIVRTSAAIKQLQAHVDLSICGQKPALGSLAPRVTRVDCMSLSGNVPGEFLVRH